ncbi:glycoside hydrolase family 36 protein [Flagellimonas halotolerans]|uniref:Glycoside hydrolase family 36 protein n=1 Tax=Flagellimonas halotolerans TaxID=3112164 RepID=A0ABU6ISJ8_9FLAO|nr:MULTISPECIES: glycoside hydrolase family 36 protein [unclassified Allomuricauda]MEC3966203.1 glycoside hydrolase family 36 protein [Muricauda sp. SYSU M86414]MEC4266111.1 glycoside hydrolase family 36 protein [Muricauda sp. SYSU M84420]
MKHLTIRITALTAIMVLIGCTSDTDNNIVLSIEHGALTYEVNGNLQTKITSKIPTSKTLTPHFQPSETIEVNGIVIDRFNYQAVQEDSVAGEMSGKQWVIEGGFENEGISILKTVRLRAYDSFPDLISTQVTYVNTSSENLIVDQWSNNAYRVPAQNDAPPFWAFQGSSSSARSDWVKPLEAGYYQKNFMGMNDSDYGGGIPVTSVWRKDINLAVGHLALVPKQVSLPTEVHSNPIEVRVGVQEEFEDHTLFKPKDTIQTLETFVSLSTGDYFANLSKYSKLMQAKGISMVEAEEGAFEPIWCAWGYERDFTLDEVIGTLPKVKELGIKWAVLDDGFQIAEGDWNANPKKFPQGNKEIKGLVDKIHDHGLKAKVWWAPLAADPDSKVLMEHPDSKIRMENGAPQYITWWNSYYLSPTKEATIEHTKETVRLFMEEWGFDGLKMDGQHMNAVAEDYTLEHPEESVEGVPGFFQMIYDQARSIKPNAVVENCPCGTCMSFYNMASMNQAVSSDPLSSWQIRHKGKTYKALVPHTAYYGDHVELSDGADDFATSFGIGAVLGTKFTWPDDNPKASGSYVLTPEKEKVWKKWFDLYNQMMLSKGTYLGGIYDIGYDRPEGHLIQKDGIHYYAFYADTWNGPISLKGLDTDKDYAIRDYFNNATLGEISGKDPVYNGSFNDFLLLEVTPK